MSAYQEALQRYRRAVSASQAAPGDRNAADELKAAGDLMLRFAINPEYRGPRLERVSLPLGMPGLGAAMYLPVTETAEAAR